MIENKKSDPEILKTLGIDFDKVHKYIPAIYWDKIYFSEEEAKASGASYYAVINTKEDSYYVSHPIESHPSLLKGVERKISNDETLIKFTDVLGETNELPKWYYENVVKVISSGNEIVCLKNPIQYDELDSVKSKIRELKPEFNKKEFCLVTGTSPENSYVYNTINSFVGNGSGYSNDKLSFCATRDRRISEVSRNTFSTFRIGVGSDGIFAKEMFLVCTAPQLEKQTEKIKKESLLEKEKEKQNKKLELRLNTKGSSNKKYSISFNQLKEHVALWHFSNLTVADEKFSHYSNEVLAKRNISGHTNIIFDKNAVSEIVSFDNKLCFKQLAKKSLNRSINSHRTSNGTQITPSEAEESRKVEIKLVDVFGVEGCVPKWMFEELVAKGETIVFFTEKTRNEVYEKVKENLIGKDLVLINIGHKTSKNHISFSRYENCSGLPSKAIEDIPNLKDPTAVKYLLFDKRNPEPEICIFGHQNFLGTDFPSNDKQYEYIVEQYNQKALRTTAKEKLETDIRNWIREKSSLPSDLVFSSKEEMLSKKTQLEMRCAPVAVWIENETTFGFCENIGYTENVVFRTTTDKQWLVDKVNSRIREFSLVEDYYYRYKPLYEAINKILEPYKSLVKLRMNSTAFINSLEWISSSKLSFRGEKYGEKPVQFELVGPQVEETKQRLKSLLEITYEKYFAREGSLPAFLKELLGEDKNEKFDILSSQINIISQENYNKLSRSRKQYNSVYCIENTDLIIFRDEFGANSSFSLSDSTNHAWIKDKLLSLLNLRKKQDELHSKFEKLTKSIGGKVEITETSTVYKSFFYHVEFPDDNTSLTKNSIDGFEKELNRYSKEIAEDTVNVSKNKKEFLFLPKKIAKEIPEAYLNLYSSRTINYMDENDPFCYGFCYEKEKKQYTWFDKNGKSALKIPKDVVFSKDSDEAVNQIRDYFETWKKEHLFLEDKALFMPKEYEWILTDPEFSKLVIFDTDMVSKKDLPKERIEISDKGITFYLNDKLYTCREFCKVQDKDFFSDLDKFRSMLPSLMKNLLKAAESDARIVAKRLVARNVISLATKILTSLAKTNKDIPVIEKFLETEKGKAVVGLVSSMILKTIKPYFGLKYDSIVEEISTEMRIGSETDLAMEAVDFIQETFQKGLAKQHPELIRVAVEAFDGANQIKKEDQDEEVYFNSTPQDQKMVN